MNAHKWGVCGVWVTHVFILPNYTMKLIMPSNTTMLNTNRETHQRNDGCSLVLMEMSWCVATHFPAQTMHQHLTSCLCKAHFGLKGLVWTSVPDKKKRMHAGTRPRHAGRLPILFVCFPLGSFQTAQGAYAGQHWEVGQRAVQHLLALEKEPRSQDPEGLS